MTREPLTAGTVAVALMMLLGASLWALFRVQVPSGNHDVLLVVIGVLTSCVQQVVGYFYGSSSNTRKKDDTIQALAANQGGTP